MFTLPAVEETLCVRVQPSPFFRLHHSAATTVSHEQRARAHSQGRKGKPNNKRFEESGTMGSDGEAKSFARQHHQSLPCTTPSTATLVSSGCRKYSHLDSGGLEPGIWSPCVRSGGLVDTTLHEGSQGLASFWGFIDYGRL